MMTKEEALELLTSNHPVVQSARHYGNTAYIEALTIAVEALKDSLCLERLDTADETHAMFVSDESALKDRKLFVHNLGILLSQTREGIMSAELDDNELVTVSYNGGYKVIINVNHDSYLAIIRDVCKAL